VFDLRLILAQRRTPSRVTDSGPRWKIAVPSKVKGITSQKKRIRPLTRAILLATFQTFSLARPISRRDNISAANRVGNRFDSATIKE